MSNDEVNQPSHYTQGEIECIDAIKAALGHNGFIIFLRGQIMKYNWRGGLKGPALTDARKSQWYNNRLVEELGLLNAAAPKQSPDCNPIK